MLKTRMKTPSSRSIAQAHSKLSISAVRKQPVRNKTTKATTITTAAAAVATKTPAVKKVSATVAKKALKASQEEAASPKITVTQVVPFSTTRPPIIYPTRKPQLPFSDKLIRPLVSAQADSPGYSIEATERFFQCGPGQYAENDKFLGLSSPVVHQIVKDAVDGWIAQGGTLQSIPMADIENLTTDPYNDIRQIGFETLAKIVKDKKTPAAQKKSIAQWYLKNGSRTKNWNIIDCSAYRIIGAWLVDNPSERGELMKLTKSGDFWEKRVAVVSSMALIKAGHFEEIIEMANYHLIPPSSGPRTIESARTSLASNPHNHLTHKAIGWMLREVGKKERAALDEFLLKDDNFLVLPTVTYSYCLEKHNLEERAVYLRKKKGGVFKRPSELLLSTD